MTAAPAGPRQGAARPAPRADADARTIADIAQLALDDRDLENHYVWQDESEPSFTLWASGEPAGGAHRDPEEMMKRAGDAIEASLDTDDHILVADTDLLGWCTDANCANPQNLHQTCEGPDSYACTGEFDDCDITLGAGVVRPAGQGASNTFCDPFGGNRYIVEAEPAKVDKFDCMAHVGLAGFSLERPIDAMVQAVSPNLVQAGGCNDAFLRDDAILVVTFISDDDGNNEVLSMQEAYDALVAAKGGDADRIVMLGLIPAPDNNCSGTPGAGEHWLQLIEMFGDRGLHGPSCADDYVEFFQGAVDVIVQACQDNPQ